ncbi:proactivator polypeptide-like 1 isoform X2 [Ambystoma mexicanum]|uniref:proactivator polypeptide-like 1 isoform X2 n=1 Tax=Ambystoma mexicanum TaxID=8296 RepID=UPI0037E7884A
MAGAMAALLILPLVLRMETARANVQQPLPERPDPCLRGPDYWCGSEETALLCMKGDYCATLWGNAPAEIFDSGVQDNDGSRELPSGDDGAKRKRKKSKIKKSVRYIKCRACKMIMKKLMESLGGDTSEEDINSALEVLCDKITSFLRGTCKRVVSEFREEIVQGIQDNADEATLCTQVNLCAATGETREELDSLELHDRCHEGPGFWCQSKETAVLCAKEDYCTELQTNSAVELESSGQSELEDSTEEEKKKKKKKKNKSKKQKKGKKGKKDKKKKRGKEDQTCTDCTRIVQNLQDSLGENPDEDAIDAALDSMCDDVDGSSSQTCTKMQENRDALIEAVKSAADPKDVCTELQMCGDGDLQERPSNIIQRGAGAFVPDPSVGKWCTICQSFTSLVKPLLADKDPEKNVGRLLAESCVDLFGNSTVCKEFLLTYGEKMEHVLMKHWDYVTTCLEVSACKAGAIAEVAEKTDALKCQEGPAAWCQSMETALHCNALSFCIKDWNK